jgi:hypothetical protein
MAFPALQSFNDCGGKAEAQEKKREAEKMLNFTEVLKATL